MKHIKFDKKQAGKKTHGTSQRYSGEIYFSNPPASVQGSETVAVNGNGGKRSGRAVKRLVGFIAVVLASLFLASIAISSINDVLAIGRSNDLVAVTIPENATTKDILNVLHDAGLIKQKWFCVLFTDTVAKIRKTRTPTYLNGVYYVRADSGVEAMLNQFKVVRSAAETVKLVFPEGWSVYQIARKLAENNVCKVDEFFAVFNDTKFNFSYLEGLNGNDKRTLLLEGYFFPDTYEFFINENANSVINKMLNNFDDKWTKKYADRAKELGLSVDEVIIIASIIQKEAANAEQMPLVSSVIHNRLEKANVYPALECNSTKDYITRFVKPVLGDAKAAYFQEQYNTYLVPGLPPGPICNPGQKSIEAALYPSDTSYNYFQHDKNGKIYMAKTVDEHNANTMEVLRVNNK